MAFSNTVFKFSLNSDVLLEIFEHACSTPASILPIASPNETVAPALAFSQVCRSWRSLALAQPRLWSSFSWGDDTTEEYTEDFKSNASIIGDERFVRIWDLYLSRSRQALLDVSLVLFERDTPEIREHLIDSIFSNQKRVQRLKLHCEQHVLPKREAYVLKSAPRLESLNIKISEYDPKPKPASTSKAIAVDLSSLVSLWDLSLSGDVFITGQFNNLNSLQLVLLRLNNVVGVDPLERPRRSFAMSTSDLFAVLNSSPNIYWITSVVNLPNTLPLPPQRLLLRRLRKLGLILKSGSAAVLNSLFQSLDLPLLTSLNLVLYGTGRGLEGIRSWAIGSSLESVTELKITCDWSRNPIDEDLRSLLLCMPRLEFLNLHSDCISSQTLSLLTLQPSENSSSNLCPELEMLHLIQNLSALRSMPSQYIVDLVTSRWRNPQKCQREVSPGYFRPSGLRDVLLQLRVSDAFDGKLNHCAKATIASLIKQGLSFQLFVLYGGGDA